MFHIINGMVESVISLLRTSNTINTQTNINVPNLGLFNLRNLSPFERDVLLQDINIDIRNSYADIPEELQSDELMREQVLREGAFGGLILNDDQGYTISTPKNNNPKRSNTAAAAA